MKTTMTAMIIALFFLTSCAVFPPPSESSWIFDKPLSDNVSKGKPQFIVETINMRNPYKKTDLKVIISIPLSELIFTKHGNGFWAKYGIEIRFTSDENGTSESKPFEFVTPLLPYEATKSAKKSFVYVISYAGKPGNYTIDITVADRIANRLDNLQITATIASLSNEFDISDPIFIKHLDLINDNTGILSQIFPLNSQALDPWTNPVFAFEIYYPNSTEKGTPVTVEYKLKKDDETIVSEQFNAVSVDEKMDIVGIQINLPKEIDNGQYELTLTAHLKNPQTSETEFTSRTVTKSIYFDSPIPKSVREMNRKVEPLEYYLPYPYQMLKRFKKAKESEEKRQILGDFFQEQGHEAITQFYNRVEEANRRYHGWRTDQGKVFVKFGPPPAGIDRISDPSWMPPLNYEIWLYPDYRAVHPFYFRLTDMYYNHKVFIFIRNPFEINTFDFGSGVNSEIAGHNFHEFNDTTKK